MRGTMLRRTLDHLRPDAAPVAPSAAAAVEMPTDVEGVITPEEIRDFKGPSPFFRSPAGALQLLSGKGPKHS